MKSIGNRQQRERKNKLIERATTSLTCINKKKLIRVKRQEVHWTPFWEVSKLHQAHVLGLRLREAMIVEGVGPIIGRFTFF